MLIEGRCHCEQCIFFVASFYSCWSVLPKALKGMKGTFRESAQVNATRQSRAERLATALYKTTERSIVRLMDAPRPIQLAVVCLAAAASVGAVVLAVKGSRKAIERHSNPLYALAEHGETPSDTMYRLDKHAAERRGQR